MKWVTLYNDPGSFIRAAQIERMIEDGRDEHGNTLYAAHAVPHGCVLETTDYTGDTAVGLVFLPGVTMRDLEGS